MYQDLLAPINSFLACPTPQQWINQAKEPGNLEVLLRDHLLCELKAAQSAIFLLKRYVLTKDEAKQLTNLTEPYEQFAYKNSGDLSSLKGKSQLSKSLESKPDCPYGQDMIDKMVLLIKEELHHFYQVLEIMVNNNIEYRPINASRYAKGMMKHAKNHEPDTLIDKLIIGAFIEARSCERFANLAPHLAPEIGKFYISLLRSESRHYQDYLALAQQIADYDITNRVAFFASIEAELITTTDTELRFHSGIPTSIGY
ncbi:tRNA isopentenyl-2-thiomethyl-A-37 hydroxylase MiaE [Shewanella aestuarii]|uniref:tRNA-(Ms[2]io[6]A)-hydroxylase n=1 Tax=Shewanella aestuarii TaxID=1028752 RepID=A0A6G9QJV6_9GAMM|nr:tRNA isopentenyl-2-thiomethyl-A-37 hydroxylase MiaE [Shewanella aestuarii]QIR14159.1 tRNA-(ms[2]io[6]A)-hydroxylase [Shewanella aestuarii]